MQPAMLLTLCIVLGFVAPPNAAMLDNVREEVRAALADDFAELRSNRIGLEELGDRVAALAAGEDEKSAKRRVLQEGAFNIYKAAGALNRAAEKRVSFWINLGTKAEFEFMACPAGSFTMGCEDDEMFAEYRHKVNLPRPFWIAKYQTTKRLYDTFRRIVNFSEEERLYGGLDIPHGGLSRKDIDAFCEFLTNRNKDRIPQGYVFRLATDAEWEYALKANCEDANDPYVRFRNGDQSVTEEIMITARSVNEFRVARGAGASDGVGGQGTVFEVGLRRPNAWGIHDMLGNGEEYVLDMIPRGSISTKYGENLLGRAHDFGYASEETEPLRYSTASKRLAITRGGKRYARFGASFYEHVVTAPTAHWNGHWTFRVVLGPDLVAERGLEGGGK